MFQVVLLAGLLATGIAATVDGVSAWSPGCEDDDPSTACCPLERLKIAESDLADWYACLDSIAAPPPELVA